MTRLRHFEHEGTARFITFSCFRRSRVFDHAGAIKVLLQELDSLRRQSGVRLLGYVIMPEHVHLVLWPIGPVQLGVLIGQMKGRAGHRIIDDWKEAVPEVLAVSTRAGRRFQVFQRRCYDHNCRSSETVKEKIDYCHKNPVARGLVQSPGEWEWSSYNWYAGCRDVPLAMDEVVF